jgi:hypothetical protein
MGGVRPNQRAWGLAMQKVVGSSPIIRFIKNPLSGFFCCLTRLAEFPMCPKKFWQSCDLGPESQALSSQDLAFRVRGDPFLHYE